MSGKLTGPWVLGTGLNLRSNDRKFVKMARSRFLDHIDLRVKNLEAADAFYRKILPALGFPKRNIEKTGVSFTALANT